MSVNKHYTFNCRFCWLNWFIRISFLDFLFWWRSLVATLTKNWYSWKKKLQPATWRLLYISSFQLVGISECHKKKQEVDFDLLCLWVPRTDKSCNLL